MATKTKTTKKAASPKATKSAKAPKAETATKTATPKKAKAKAATNGKAKSKKLSAIDAAAQVLSSSKGSMNCKYLIETIAAKGLWTSPGGATPWATLYSAMLREITEKGKDARFKKTERGQFAANA